MEHEHGFECGRKLETPFKISQRTVCLHEAVESSACTVNINDAVFVTRSIRHAIKSSR